MLFWPIVLSAASEWAMRAMDGSGEVPHGETGQRLGQPELPHPVSLVTLIQPIQAFSSQRACARRSQTPEARI